MKLNYNIDNLNIVDSENVDTGEIVRGNWRDESEPNGFESL